MMFLRDWICDAFNAPSRRVLLCLSLLAMPVVAAAQTTVIDTMNPPIILAGPKGDVGSTIFVIGSGEPSASAGRSGDITISMANALLYQKVMGAWVLQGSIRGAAGPAGGFGPKGDTGPQGPQGNRGATWWQSAGAPDNTIGLDGDFWFRTDTFDVYKRVSGIYGVVASLNAAATAQATIAQTQANAAAASAASAASSASGASGSASAAATSASNAASSASSAASQASAAGTSAGNAATSASNAATSASAASASATAAANSATQASTNAAAATRIKVETLTVTATNTLSSLSSSYATPLAMLVVNGVSYVLTGGSPPFSISGTTVTWSAANSGVTLATTDSVVAIYSF